MRFPQMKNNANLVRDFIDDVLNHGNIEAPENIFTKTSSSRLHFPVKDRDLAV